MTRFLWLAQVVLNVPMLRLMLGVKKDVATVVEGQTTLDQKLSRLI